VWPNRSHRHDKLLRQYRRPTRTLKVLVRLVEFEVRVERHDVRRSACTARAPTATSTRQDSTRSRRCQTLPFVTTMQENVEKGSNRAVV